MPVMIDYNVQYEGILWSAGQDTYKSTRIVQAHMNITNNRYSCLSYF
jgi:hypothetical protein